MDNRKANKIIWSVIIIILIIIAASTCNGGHSSQPTAAEQTDNAKEWKKMNVDQKDSLLNKLMKGHDFEGVGNLSKEIKEQLDSAYNSDIVWQIEPSPYSEFAQVLYPDSGWVTTTFKCSYRNYYNKRKYVLGSIRFKYHPEDKSLVIDKWDYNEMKDPDEDENKIKITIEN